MVFFISVIGAGLFTIWHGILFQLSKQLPQDHETFENLRDELH